MHYGSTDEPACWDWCNQGQQGTDTRRQASDTLFVPELAEAIRTSA